MWQDLVTNLTRLRELLISLTTFIKERYQVPLVVPLMVGCILIHQTLRFTFIMADGLQSAREHQQQAIYLWKQGIILRLRMGIF